MSKEEILNKMKLLQAEYSKLNEEYKKLKLEEEQRTYMSRQMATLEQFRKKYNFYAHLSGKTEQVDWQKVETSLKEGSMEDGPSLGWDETGMPGFGGSTGSNQWFYPLVEIEDDARKYVERELKRQELSSRRK
jgi:hypothetical protein